MDTILVARVRVCLEPQARWPLRTGCRPNHRLPGRRNDYFLGSLTFEGQDSLEPGQRAEAVGRFIILEEDLACFTPGFQWEVCAGPDNVIGSVEYLHGIQETGRRSAKDAV